MSRKQAREVAFKLLFSLSPAEGPALELACDGEVPTGPELEYIKKLTAVALENIETIDELIKKQSRGFAFDRIFKTDLTALRMGIAEIRYFGTPAAVAANEAVEIAKKYGTEKSGGFVNGILAAVIAT